jgi:hypothetical protein
MDPHVREIMKTSFRFILLFLLALAAACASVTDPSEEFTPMLAKWQWAWNSSNPDRLIALYHPDSMPAIEKEVGGSDIGKDIASHMACGGKIKNIQFLRAYDQNTVLATRISFEKLKDFPVVFKCRQKDDKTLFLDFLPGQDPTRHADSKVIEPFLKQWETAWNSGAPDGLLQQMHSFGKIQRDLNDKRVPKTFIDKQFQMLYQELGRIRSHVVKDFKARTNEYLVAFTYESGQTILAAINLQKDHDGEWRIFSFDLDDGDRALRTPDSWNPQ